MIILKEEKNKLDKLNNTLKWMTNRRETLIYLQKAVRYSIEQNNVLDIKKEEKRIKEFRKEEKIWWKNTLMCWDEIDKEQKEYLIERSFV